MNWPGVSFVTSLGTGDWAETGVGQSELTTPKSNRKMRATDKTGVVIVLLFMVLPGSYFAQFHLTAISSSLGWVTEVLVWFENHLSVRVVKYDCESPQHLRPDGACNIRCRENARSIL